MQKPADLDSVCQTVSHHRALLGQHSQALKEVMETFRDLLVNIFTIQDQMNQPPSSADPPPSTAASAPEPLPAVKEPWVPALDSYKGNIGLCLSFLFSM